ncbi:hypothetical protein [Bacillus sp. REN3]|uniref:TraR/DksA family transcriptional regulator n=1 Tax=Bacillus sp. REN3 TaxID=2802440 RepID=UPI001AEE66EC|nr:hypothetical protein [Bacillus sp. REN3]
MEGNLDIIYSELLEMRAELSAYLGTSHPNPVILHDIISEIEDIDSALAKIRTGEYGKCEVCGTNMPAKLLQSIPTAASVHDFSEIQKYYRKPLYC